MQLKPLFIFSLPRSGSTLLQRVLMSHSKISSTAEPWLLLPLLQMLKKEGTVTTYSHQNCQKAMVDIVSNMRGGKPEYNHLLKEFVESIYASTSKDGSVYFLDKTPRYYMIIPEIVELFPEAKFVFLFRNPVHVYASMLMREKVRSGDCFIMLRI
jgi:Sulfotransferase family